MEYYKIGFHFFHLLKCSYFAVLSSLSKSVDGLLSLAVTPTVNSDVQWGHLVALYFRSEEPHVWTPVTDVSRMPSSAWKKKKYNTINS